MEKIYYTTIGLEIHAEMNTKRKMFCDCINDPFHSDPNQNICPVCMAHPGTLPVPNKQAIENVIRVGLAIGPTDNSNIANFSEFDRKNYFYPDIPKGYQISQYKYPIVSGGQLAGVDITRIHLEEDTATSKHSANKTLIDYNRAGVPLMELVTEPCIHSPEDAAKFGRELQLLLQYLGVSNANMEKGEMRVELNLSISPDKDKFGTKVEVKNINSFSAVERAAKFEIERMKKLYEEGRENEIVQETRGWDEVKQQTFSQRAKENANDYRYFPEPDIPKFYLHEMFNLDELKGALPELPSQKRMRYMKIWSHYFDNKDNAEWDKAEIEKIIDIFVFDQKKSAYLDELIKIYKINKVNPSLELAINITINNLIPLSQEKTVLKDWYGFCRPEKIAAIEEMKSQGIISAPQLKEIVLGCFLNDVDPRNYAKENNLYQQNDPEAIKRVAQEVIDANPTVIETYKGGKENAIMSLVGQIMKKTNGSANPQMALEILKELIK